jgi:hypothetical protein
MLSKGNMCLYPTTLIESNAMKKLLALFVSAVLLCPMWARAQVPNSSTTQTTVGAIGEMVFYFPELLKIPNIYVYLQDGTLISGNKISNFSINAMLFNNNSYSIGLMGMADVIGDASGGGDVPVTGSILASTTSGWGNYSMQINVGTTAFVCTLTQSTLNGKCYGLASQGQVSVKYRGRY